MQNNDKALIEVDNLEIMLQKKLILNKLSFKLFPNKIIGFIGPNGAGKTTTIKTLIGAFKYKKGSISIKGFKPGTKEANSLIGYIPESSKFPNYLNVFNYLKTMAILSGIKKEKVNDITNEILENLDMKEFAKKNPNNLSSGQKKKIMLAQALINNPELLIFDEPAANLDPIARKEFFLSLKKLKKENKTVFLSSHILAELESIIDDVVFIYNGEILYSGSVKKLKQNKFSSFIKTTNNFSTLDLLKQNSIMAVINSDDKIEILNLNFENWNKIIHLISGSNHKIISIETTDLTTIYKDMLEEHLNNKKEI